MGFDIDLNLKWFRGTLKPKKIYDQFWQQNMLNWVLLRRNPMEDGAISGFSGQKSVPE